MGTCIFTYYAMHFLSNYGSHYCLTKMGLVESPFRSNSSTKAFYLEKLKKYYVDLDCLLLGDSMVSKGHWAEMLTDLKVLNMGVGGYDLAEIWSLIPIVSELSPKMIVVMAGVIDCRYTDNVKGVFDQYIKLVKELKKKRCPVIVCSTLPPSKYYHRANNTKENVYKLNSLLQSASANVGFIYLDVTKELCMDGYLNTIFTYDGGHLNHIGYLKWAERIRESIQNCAATK